MQALVKLVMKSLYGVQIRKDVDESYFCMSENWMKTDYDENVFGLPDIVKWNLYWKDKKDARLDDDCDIKNILPAQLGAFILSNSKRILNDFLEKQMDFKLKILNIQIRRVCIQKENFGMCWIKPV